MSELEQLRTAVRKLAVLARKTHYTCEDDWYSCPMSEDGCSNDEAPQGCTCGAETHNDRIDDIIGALESGELSPSHPMQPLLYDEHGTIRFKENAIVRTLLDRDPAFTLNDLARMDFSRDDWDQFAQLIGYSVGGFCDLSYVHETSKDMACARMEKLRLAKRR